MDDKFVLAIVAASSALLGAVIPTIFNYLNNKQQRKFGADKLILEKQRDVYADLLLSLQDMINFQTDPEKFYQLQRRVLQVAIYGHEHPASIVQEYYSEIVKSGQGTRANLNNDEHREYQRKILSSMRESMGLTGLDEFEIVGFHPPGT